jgi:serine O-acetyltransferase
MATDIRLKEALPEITEAIVATYTECSRTSHLGHKPLPSREAVVEILTDLLDILYPGYWRRQNLHIGTGAGRTYTSATSNITSAI